MASSAEALDRIRAALCQAPDLGRAVALVHRRLSPPAGAVLILQVESVHFQADLILRAASPRPAAFLAVSRDLVVVLVHPTPRCLPAERCPPAAFPSPAVQFLRAEPCPR